jgi:hypothetical protein
MTHSNSEPDFDLVEHGEHSRTGNWFLRKTANTTRGQICPPTTSNGYGNNHLHYPGTSEIILGGAQMKTLCSDLEQIPAKLTDFADKDLLQPINLARFLFGKVIPPCREAR